MDDVEIVGALSRHLAAHADNRARLLVDPVRMENVASDLAYDDPALRNALRALAALRVERAFLGQDRPTHEVLGELAHRLIHQQGIRDDAAWRSVSLLEAACYGPRTADLSAAAATTFSMPPAPAGPPRAALGTPTILGSAPQADPALAPSRHTPVPPPPHLQTPADRQTPAHPQTPGARPSRPSPSGPRSRRPLVAAIGAIGAVVLVGAVAAAVLTRSPSIGPVTGLVADTSATPGSVVLRWTAVDGAGGYEVCREGRTCEQVAATTFTDTPSDSFSHTYSVRARLGSASGSPATVAAAPVALALGPVERALVASMSDELVKKGTCKRVTTTAAGATGGVTCTAVPGGSDGAATVWALQFESRAALDQVFADDTPGPNTPSCPTTTTTTWNFTTDPDTDVGNIACYLTTTDKKAVVAWTYWGRQVIMYGVSDGNDTSAAYQWWRSATIPAA